jgi:anti-anti-sigma factor
MVNFNIEENITEEKSLVCTFGERMDTVKCQEVETELLNKVVETKMPVIFDVEKVAYVSSAFLRLCLRTAKEVGSGNFSIVNVQPNVKKVFKIAGFDKQLTIT